VATKPALLAGGNPQIAKADGDAAVQGQQFRGGDLGSGPPCGKSAKKPANTIGVASRLLAAISLLTNALIAHKMCAFYCCIGVPGFGPHTVVGSWFSGSITWLSMLT